MQKTVLIFILVTCCIISVTVAEKFSDSNSANNTRENSEIDGRKRTKLLYPFGFLGGFWLGGFHALAALVAIKFKVVLIAIFVFGAIFYGIRIWAGKGIGCPEPSIVKEPFYPHGITAYSHSSPDILYSNPGMYYPSYQGAEVISGGTDVPAEVLAGSHYKRKGRSSNVADETARQMPNGFDVAEIIFGFLNVRSLECKRRFVCEVDYLSRRDPWIRLGYRMFGQSLFSKYRTTEAMKIRKYRECLKLYEGCKTPTEEEAHKVGYVEVQMTNRTDSNRNTTKLI